MSITAQDAQQATTTPIAVRENALLQRFGAPRQGREARPLFIVGMNGSGTTMLLDSLGRHPSLYAFPEETLLIPHLIVSSPRFGDLEDDENFKRLWDEVRGILAFRQCNGGDIPLAPPDWRDWPRDLATLLDAMFSWFASREGKTRWCEKTPQHVQHIRALAKLFPKAKFIHVIRDGRDCAASFNRRWHRTPELTMYRWKMVVRHGDRQGRELGPGRYLAVRFEDLTSNPEPLLRRICDFLGEPFDAAVLESSDPYLQPADGIAAGRIRPNSGNWRQRFDEETVKRLDGIGGTTLARFGYETGLPLVDEDPPRLKRRWWAARDYVVQYSDQLLRRVTGRSRKPWWILLSRPLVAVRQLRTNRY